MADEILWALCPWFEECGEYPVHPDDVSRIREFNPYGVVFKVLAKEHEYTVIGSGDDLFRVRPDILELINPEVNWLFEVGETVSVVGKSYTGTVARISWHHTEKKPIYSLKVDGKLRSKRYFPEDLGNI